MDNHVSLHFEDYVVIVLVLLIPVGIGVLFAVKDFKHSTRDEYLLGGRRMSLLPVTLSIFATYNSAVTFLGIPVEMYTFGPMFATSTLGWGLGSVFIAFLIVPLIYPLRLTSLYEYLQMRFESRLVRITAVVIMILQTIVIMSLALLAPALALQAGAGLSTWMSVGIVGVVGTFYTSIGGIKSVLWTDTFQATIMFVCIFSVIIKGSLTVGGGSSLWLIAEEGARTSFNSFNPDPRIRHSWWATSIGAMFIWIALASNQSGFQRIASARSAKVAKTAFVFNGVLMAIYGASLMGVGIVIYAYFHFLGCDPVTSGLMKSRNQLPIYFIMHAFEDSHGMAGLYMAAVLSGALSTISSGINAMAANTVEDILKQPLNKVKESTAIIITKVFVIMYGIIVIGLAYAASYLDGTLTQLSITVVAASGGPLFGLLLLGAISPWPNKFGAHGGVVIGLAFNLWIGMGNQFYGEKPKPLPPIPGICYVNNSEIDFAYKYLYNSNTTSILLSRNESITHKELGHREYSNFFFYNISYEWYAIIGIVVTVFFGSLISYCTRKYSKPSCRPELLLPCVRKFWSIREERYNEEDKNVHSAMQNIKMLQVEIEDDVTSEMPNISTGNDEVQLDSNKLI